MPVMNGIEATQKIRQEFSGEHQPIIIALTANAFREDEERYLRSGMDYVVTKPINREKLIEVLSKVQKRDFQKG